MKKVLYLSYDGLTDNLGQSQVLPYLIGLSQKRFRLTIISFEKQEKFILLKDKIQDICDAHDIDWYPKFYTKKPPVYSTIKDLRLMRKTAKKLHQQTTFSLVHCRSYLPGIVGMFMKKKYQLSFLFDMRGFWPDERVEGKIWNLKNPLYKIIYTYFKRKETQLFKSADHVISLTHAGKSILLREKKWQLSESKVTVIPCCVDMDAFAPKKLKDQSKENLRKALGISVEQKILGYVGSIGTWYMLDEMLDFFKAQYETNHQLLFLFVTHEPSEYIFSKVKEKSIPEKAVRIASSSHKYVPLHLSLFDYALFFIRPTFSKQASSPTKQGELMAMGIPIVCNSGVGDTDTIVRKYQSGVILETLNRAHYSAVDLSKITFDPNQIRKGAKEVYELEKGVERYAGIYFGR